MIINILFVVCLAIVVWEWVIKPLIAKLRVKKMLDEVETLLENIAKRKDVTKR